MDNRSRFVLQHFMSKGILSTKDVKEIIRKCKERFAQEDDSEFDIRLLIEVIKKAIAPFNLDIKKGLDEEDGSSYYCLVNTVETQISQLASIYEKNELEFFKKLVEYVVDTDDGKIGSLAAVNLSEKLHKRMGKEEAELLLVRLEKDKWIKKGKDGKISLSVRSLVELEQFLKEVYSEVVRQCYMCNNVCLLGETCENCSVKIHLHCAKKLFDRQGDDRRCPCSDCRSPWGQIILNSTQS